MKFRGFFRYFEPRFTNAHFFPKRIGTAVHNRDVKLLILNKGIK